MKFSWLFLALCALSIGSESVLAADVQKENVPEALATVSPLKVETDMKMMTKQEEGKIVEHTPIEMADGKDESLLAKKDSPDEEQNNKQMEKVAEMKEDEIATALQDEKEAEMLKRPGMRRLARYLRNFHDRQVFLANAALAAQKSNSVADEDESAIAEERAIRRRKRIRRRNTKNKVKSRYSNRLVANRRHKSRPQKNGKRKSVRPGNSNRKKNRKNVRVVYIRDHPVRRRVSSGLKHKSGIRSGSRRKSSKPTSQKDKKKSKKNKNKKQTNHRDQNQQQDSNNDREEENQNDSSMESNEAAQE